MIFQTVLIAEDHQSVKISVEQTLKDLGLIDPHYAYYCDDALLRLKKALLDNLPYELLITDLSFQEDGREQKLNDGIALIEAARKLQPALKVLVFSAEANPAVVSMLFKQHDINGYVRKGRQDALELRDALEAISKNKKYVPAEFQQAMRTKNAHDFSGYDIVIISQLANGTLQKDIPAYLQQQNMTPSGLSSIEKRLNQIKEALGFAKNEQLVAYCKDRRII